MKNLNKISLDSLSQVLPVIEVDEMRSFVGGAYEDETIDGGTLPEVTCYATGRYDYDDWYFVDCYADSFNHTFGRGGSGCNYSSCDPDPSVGGGGGGGSQTQDSTNTNKIHPLFQDYREVFKCRSYGIPELGFLGNYKTDVDVRIQNGYSVVSVDCMIPKEIQTKYQLSFGASIEIFVDGNEKSAKTIPVMPQYNNGYFVPINDIYDILPIGEVTINLNEYKGREVEIEVHSYESQEKWEGNSSNWIPNQSSKIRLQ